MNSSICFKSDIGKEYKPLRDIIFIKPDNGPEKSGRFFIPEAYRAKLSVGTIIAAGKGYYHKKNGKFIPVTLKQGDYVAFDYGVIDFRTKEFENIDGRLEEIIITGARDCQLIIKDEELIPLFGRVLVEPIKEISQSGKLHIPFTGYIDRGMVYNPGDNENLKKGDFIKYHMRWASEIHFADKMLISVRSSQIDCVIK